MEAQRKTPRVRLSVNSLARVGVELFYAERFTGGRVKLRCKCCGQIWVSDLLPGGRLPRGWWRCPECGGCWARGIVPED